MEAEGLDVAQLAPSVVQRFLAERRFQGWCRIAKASKTLVEQDVRGRHLKTRRFCAGLLDEYDALWTFCVVSGISPTNNVAERALRHSVLLRKIQLGTQSENGNRWIERICTARET